MGNFWTLDKVYELSPDSSSLSAAKGLTGLSKWSDLGYSDRAIWGQCQGSGKSPYQTRIDLQGPAFKCTCPSRKFPCKHSLALFILFINEQSKFQQKDVPGWVSEWLENRDQKSETKEKKNIEAEKKPDPEAQEKRIAQRENKIQSGLDELSLWLSDLIGQGLAWGHNQPYSYWAGMAARLVDAQAPGLAGRVKKMGEMSAKCADWQIKLAQEIGRTSLLVKAYRNIDDFDAGLQAEIRSLIGWTVPKEQVLGTESVKDVWQVLGQQIEQQDNLKVQRTWLFGVNAGRFALILDFAVGNAVLEKTLFTGTQVEAEICYYPGINPLRALVKNITPDPVRIMPLQNDNNIAQMMRNYSQRLAENPWTDIVPVVLSPVRLISEVHDNIGQAHWKLVDINSKTVLLSPEFRQFWHVLSVSRGDWFSAFGLWNGEEFYPLSMICDNNFYIVLDNPIAGMRGIG